MSYNDELSKARAELAAVQERLAKLEAQAKEKAFKAAQPWEPKGGKWVLSAIGKVSEYGSDMRPHSLAGSAYPTREAAESAFPYFTFFKRLCCLAAELNPSGKVGGNYWVCRCLTSGDWCAGKDSAGDYTGLFETHEAAQKAAAILTRDGWKVPAL